LTFDVFWGLKTKKIQKLVFFGLVFSLGRNTRRFRPFVRLFVDFVYTGYVSSRSKVY